MLPPSATQTTTLPADYPDDLEGFAELYRTGDAVPGTTAAASNNAVHLAHQPRLESASNPLFLPNFPKT
eukprot:6453853-Pyramimonas_sp.AAC.1